jgi:hypothetical protein
MNAKTGLKLLFSVILLSMLAVTGWAGHECPLFAVPRPVATHPWFLATMADAYWGFVTFFVWVAYKQTRWSAKISWFFAIILLGNIAMSVYWLSELFTEPAADSLEKLLITKRSGPGTLGILLAILGAAVTYLGYVTA